MATLRWKKPKVKEQELEVNRQAGHRIAYSVFNNNTTTRETIQTFPATQLHKTLQKAPN